MARRAFVAGNWKMHTTRESAVALAGAISSGTEGDADSVQVGVAPPFVYLDAVGQALVGGRVDLGAQDAYFESSGAFTGEVSVEMLRDLGVSFCLAGHSERRHVLGESGEIVGRKAGAIYGSGMTLVHCVGEKMEERDAGQTLAVVGRQLDELPVAKIDDPERLVIAYEPVWAIGTGRVATEAQAQEVHAYIRQVMGRKWGVDFADQVRIQYGGSVKPDNCGGIFGQPDVDGALVGGAALKAESFLAIVKSAG